MTISNSMALSSAFWTAARGRKLPDETGEVVGLAVNDALESRVSFFTPMTPPGGSSNSVSFEPSAKPSTGSKPALLARPLSLLHVHLNQTD